MKKEKALKIADWTVSKTRIGAACVQLHSSEIRGNVSMGAGALKEQHPRASLVPHEGSPEKVILQWCSPAFQTKPEQCHCEPFVLIPLHSSQLNTLHELTLPGLPAGMVATTTCGCQWCPNPVGIVSPAWTHAQGYEKLPGELLLCTAFHQQSFWHLSPLYYCQNQKGSATTPAVMDERSLPEPNASWSPRTEGPQPLGWGAPPPARLLLQWAGRQLKENRPRRKVFAWKWMFFTADFHVLRQFGA